MIPCGFANMLIGKFISVIPCLYALLLLIPHPNTAHGVAVNLAGRFFLGMVQ